MKVSEITLRTLELFGRLDEDAPDRELVERVYLPAAKHHIMGYTSMTEEQLDKHEDLTVAVMCLCVHFYENRSMTEESMQENRTVMSIIGKYDCNLVPKGDGK